MQLAKEHIEYLKNVIRVAKILKVENVILDKEAVRGFFQEEGIIILQRNNLPNFEFKTLGISRISTLDSRLSLLCGDVNIEFEEKDKTPTEKIVSKLSLSDSKTIVDFKCADPNTFTAKAPKVLKDPIFFTFSISEDSILTLSKAQSAMHGENITLKGSKTGVVAKLNDVEGDMLNHVITESLIFAPEATENKFQLIFKSKILMPILKNAIIDKEELIVNITQRGLLNLNFLGIDIYIHREVI
jgi:hypothetical protein